MTLYLIDTDWIVDSLHGQRQAEQRLIELAPEGPIVTRTRRHFERVPDLKLYPEI